MKTSRTRIVVGTEPYVLRTAVQKILAADPRLDVILVPAAGDPLELSTEADVVMVSGPLELPDVVVALLAETSTRIELSRNGETQSLPFQGLSRLPELFAAIASLFPMVDLTDGERAPPNGGNRSDPETGGASRDP